MEDVHPVPSSLQTLLASHKSPNPSTSSHLNHLALQIAHNLHFQHNWTQLRIHQSTHEHGPLPRPIISGLPPKRLYVHPDEQLEVLREQKREGKPGLPDLESEREWVLPSHLREKWSLKAFGEVFDRISIVPPAEGGEVVFPDDQTSGNASGADAVDVDSSNTWRISQPKRLLLATLDDDSTIAYYIIHDGIVKPRQN